MKKSSARRVALVALLGTSLLVAPQAATASHSHHKHHEKLTVTVTSPENINIELPKGQACKGFALGVDLRDSRARIKTFTNKAGVVVRTIEEGKGYKKTYTNLTTKKSVTFPSKFFSTDTVYQKNGFQTVTSTGHFGLILFPTDVPAGPSTTEYVGRVVYTINPAPPNVFTLKKVNAKSTDVCAKLSGKSGKKGRR
jgi:hypothetical protein